ncbi:hypothetical protein ACJMK2_025426 [Sinanodonta woodiana]|uniref:Uncharacterized protein n=1 Tax=Sinanodonta woodiana TaxID=1069815 RepID=A0ABD3XK68_SINWO
MEAECFVAIILLFSFLDGGLVVDCRYNQEAKSSHHAKYHLSQCCQDFQCYQVAFNSLNNSAVFYQSEVSVSDPNVISFWKKRQHIVFQTPICFKTSSYRVPIPGCKFGVGSKVSAVIRPVSGFEL